MPQVRLARKTVWTEDAPDVFTGLGQRMLTTDAGDHAADGCPRRSSIGAAATEHGRRGG